MPDPIDDGREALNGAGPTKDLWADATTRAADAAGVPLAPLEHPRRRGTWLAVAAAVALVAGTVSVLNDDDTSVDTTPAGLGSVACEITVVPEGAAAGPSPDIPARGPAVDPEAGVTVHGTSVCATPCP